MDKFIVKTPAVPSCSTTGKTKSHLPSNLTAKDRAEKYATGTFHVDDGLMFCSLCKVVIDHLRKSSLNFSPNSLKIAYFLFFDVKINVRAA